MECLLCSVWARMPYARRPTTPTSSQETEGALLVGYWIASRAESVPRICEYHMNILGMLDRQEERRIEVEKIAQEEAKQREANLSQTFHLHQRQQTILRAARAEISPEIVPSFVPQALIPMPAQQPISEDFKLGPGPLVNENIVTAPPPMPVEVNPAQPYLAKPGTMEAALEMAKLPPVEGAKVTHPCPSCGVAITTGDVHAC